MKYLLLLLIIANITISKAIQISPSPRISISELGFDTTGNWMLEMSCENMFGIPDEPIFDSVFICSSTGRSQLKTFNTPQGEVVIVTINKDSLTSNFTINPAGDSILLEYYCYKYNFNGDFKKQTKPLIFGDFNNATLKAPKADITIAAYPNFCDYDPWSKVSTYDKLFCANKHPNIGFKNDSSGMCGTLKGKIYDENNQPLTNSLIAFYTTGISKLSTKSDGSYSVRLLNGQKTLNSIFYTENRSRVTVKIAPIDFDISIDSITTRDIHIQQITAIKETKKTDIKLLKISPNPTLTLTLQYEISIPVKSSTSYIEMLGLNGQTIARFPITENSGKINLPTNTTNGTYILQLFVNNKSYGNTKVVVAK